MTDQSVKLILYDSDLFNYEKYVASFYVRKALTRSHIVYINNKSICIS